MTKNPGTKNLLRTVTASLIVAASSFAAALASPAQDLFDQATFYLEFQYFGPSKVDLKTLTGKYQAELDKACADAKDTCGYDKVEPLLQKLFADLEDGHAYYQTAEQSQAERANATGTATTPTPRLGITHTGFLETEGERVQFGGFSEDVVKAVVEGKAKLLSNDRLIASVLPGSPAEKAGLRPGDRWVGFNGTLFSSFTSIQEFAKFFATFGERIRASETVTMSLVRGIERQKLEISVKGELINPSDFPRLEVRSDGVAILQIPTFIIEGIGQRVHDLVREAQAKNVKAIILDMRGNPGGFPSERAIAGGAFFENPEILRRVPRYNADTLTREEGFTDGVYFQRLLNGPVFQKLPVQNPTLWKGPMVVLVDEACGSACEYMSAYFQRAKRGQVIGQVTAGVGNTDSVRNPLINGAVAAFPQNLAYWTDGTRLPDKITPDITTPNLDAYALFETGRDEMLLKALEVLGL
jgi:carboxyl-terminal processing protease